MCAHHRNQGLRRNHPKRYSLFILFLKAAKSAQSSSQGRRACHVRAGGSRSSSYNPRSRGPHHQRGTKTRSNERLRRIAAQLRARRSVNIAHADASHNSGRSHKRQRSGNVRLPIRGARATGSRREGEERRSRRWTDGRSLTPS